MTRRRFTALTSAGAASALASPRLGAAPARRPNILLINADDHRPDGIGALGNKELQTPNLDALVRRGCAFRCAYTMGAHVGAVCLPSRTQLLTGYSLPRAIQVLQNRLKPDPAVFMPRVLSAAGYETYHIGKPGNEFGPGIRAFDHNLERGDRGEERRTSSKHHADALISFFQQRAKDKPFFVYCAPPVPHDPRLAEERFHRLYDPAKITLPANFAPEHPFDNGELRIRDEKLLPWPRTPEAVRKELADYYACITGLDHHLGRVFDCLRALGQLDDTVIVFCGDNGLSLGEHGLLGKQNLYEFGGMHVPLVIAGPGIPHGETNALAYHLDLLPTFCDLAGAKRPAVLDGQSLLPVVRGEAKQVRAAAFTAYRDVQRAVRDERWKLIHYPKINKTQLFDLQADPHEMSDLSAKPEHADTLRRMQELLRREQRAWGDTLA